ncbi:MAG: glycosyltransferase [Proteobacteria bacterium]|nr:glycosyltransferase [Pseudomonadota bacterium]
MDKLLRLLHVVPTYLPAVRYGGTILAVHALCRELAARGHDVHVFTTSVDGPEDSNVPLGRPVDVEGVKVTYFPSRSLRRLYWAPPLKRALAAAMGGFDLVHVHALYLWPPWVAARLAKARRRPYVVSPHGMLVPELIRRKNRWVKAAWLALIDRRTLEEANAVHTASTVEALHLEGFGWSLPRVITIPHGVDEPPPTAGRPLTDDVAAAVAGGGIVLALGRISWEKGLDRLLAALPFAPSAKVVIAGADADGEAARLTDKARELGVSDRVTILARFVEGADKEALFAAARVFAMTSLSENFGLSAFEAMRRGVPVLATPNVGMSEIVREAGAGAVVEADPAAISAGLNALLGNAAASEAMGRAGQARVIADYSWQAVTRRMEDLYRSLLPVKA